MSSTQSGWQRYERLIARLMADQYSTDLCVTPNARVMGRISGRSRQLDVLIDARHDSDSSRRIIVDAKKRKRKIDVPQVEAFRGLMEDVGATHGYLVCPVGHTAAAERRAQQAVTIRLVPLDYLENFDPRTWPPCQGRECAHGRVFWDGYPGITMRTSVLSGPEAGQAAELVFIHYVGKCDRCGRFHVKCLSCNELFSLGDEDEHQCRCKPLWFWLTSIETDEIGHPSAELHAVLLNGNVMTADRRPM